MRHGRVGVQEVRERGASHCGRPEANAINCGSMRCLGVCVDTAAAVSRRTCCPQSRSGLRDRTETWRLLTSGVGRGRRRRRRDAQAMERMGQHRKG